MLRAPRLPWKRTADFEFGPPPVAHKLTRSNGEIRLRIRPSRVAIGQSALCTCAEITQLNGLAPAKRMPLRDPTQHTTFDRRLTVAPWAGQRERVR